MATTSPVLKAENTTPAPSTGDSKSGFDGAVELVTQNAEAAKAALTTSDTQGSKNAPWSDAGFKKFKNPSSMDIKDDGTFLWCYIDAYANDQKTTLARLMTSDAIPRKGEPLVSFEFLMEDKLDYSISHTWDSGTDFVSNMSQKIVNGVNESSAIQAMIKLPQNLTNTQNAINGDESKWGDPMTVLKKGAVLTASSGTQLRMDEAKLFKNTERQILTLNFTLGVWKSSSGSSYTDKLYNDIVLPVKSLQWCSSAYAKDLFTIEYPSIFSLKIKTENGSKSLLEMEYCVCTAVQPTFKAPWVNGMPMTCDLTLTFENLLPIYKQTFQNGGWNGLG